MTKGRATLPLSMVAEQDPLFIALGGPKAHDSSGREDKGESSDSPLKRESVTSTSAERTCGEAPVWELESPQQP
jgi:hypothetical protein